MASNNGMNRDRLIATFMNRTRRNRKPTPGDRTARLPRTGQGENARFARSGPNVPPSRITEDDPRWNASTMGNKTGYYKGAWYDRGKKSRGGRNYNKGNRPG